nr:sulfatase-like hydrolase/transferase [Candidatus Krumholzibacteria bacterium]
MNEAKRRGLSWPMILAQLAGLTALAVGQPLLQMIRDNAEFLAVHESGIGDVLLLVFFLFGVLPLIMSLPVTLLGRILPRAQAWLQGILLGSLLALALLPMTGRLFPDAPAVAVALAAAVGVVFLLVYARAETLRRNLGQLAWVVPIFLVLFFSAGSVRSALFGGGEAATGDGGNTTTPVVMIICDEFPLASLLTADHELDCELYPNFCRLQEISTWFPNATTISPATLRSVPSIMTGKFSDWKAAPTLADHPANVFTLLASSHRVVALETQTSLCPPELATARAPGVGVRLETLFLDLGILYQHLVVPRLWRGGLVPIDDKWGNFLEQGGEYSADGSARTRLEELSHFIAQLDGGSSPVLGVAHVLLPHSPYRYLPDGTAYNTRLRAPSRPDGTWGPDDVLIAHSMRRHLLQAVAVDRRIGELLDQLEGAGILEAAAVVVTADHGLCFRAGLHRRQFYPGNEADIMSVPLFFKQPGQMQGVVDPRHAQTVDIMPSLVAALGLDPGWEFDGHNLLDANFERSRLDFLDQDRYEHVQVDPALMRTKDDAIAMRDELFGTTGDYHRYFTMFDENGWLGRPLADLEILPASALQGRILEEHLLEQVDLAGPFIPAEINGTLAGYSGGGRATLALALNGRLAGFTRTYLDAPEPGLLDWQVTAAPRFFHNGKNEAALFLVEGSGDSATLRRIPLKTPSFLKTNLGGQHVAGIREEGLSLHSHDWNGTPIRWTLGHGTWTVPLKPGEKPHYLTVEIMSSGPTQSSLEVVANGVTLLEQYLPRGEWNTRLPLDAVTMDGQLVVELKSGTFVPAKHNPESSDQRTLGLAVSTLRLD